MEKVITKAVQQVAPPICRLGKRFEQFIRHSFVFKSFSLDSFLSHNYNSSMMEYNFTNNIFGKKNAFTLAEVLITLGIIGVVAALTIPTLMSSIQNRQLEVGLKNAYSTLTQALKMYEQDNGYPLTSSNVGQNQLKPILMKYIKNVEFCEK